MRENYSPQEKKHSVMQSAMERLQTEAEAGDHDRMYKVVHVKKGMMDIKAKTSYEAAKKFAQEKGLKSTAGVDVHLYPLEEAKLDKNFFRNIASMDQPHDEIERLLTADGPEGDVIRREYEITAGENGLHPDDDFEEVLDMMVHDFEDMTFENMNFMVAPPNKNPKFKSNMPIAKPKKYDHNYRLRTISPAPMPGMPGFGDRKIDKRPITTNLFNDTKVGEGKKNKNKMGPQEIMPGDRVEHEGDMYEVVAVDGDILTVDNLQNGNRTKFKMDDVTRLFGADAMTDQDEEDLNAMFRRLDKTPSGSLKHVATEGYYTMPDIDKERYTEMPGLEGPFQTRSGKPIYYDPKEGAYYDRDTDMYLTYDEFKALDNDMKEAMTDKEVNDFHNALDKVVHKHIGHSSDEDEEKERLTKKVKEGNYPSKLAKGHKNYKAQQAAVAISKQNSSLIHRMRDVLKLDESTDADTVIAEYTRATLDGRHNTWGKVCKQIDYIRSLVKEDINLKNVKSQILRMHEREALDRKVIVKEDINKLRQIVKDKSAMSIKFSDGSMKVDMTTANIFVQMYDRMKERNQNKIDDMMQTKAGFLKVLDFFYGAMK